MDYLNIKTDTVVSSEVYNNQNLSGQERVIDICKKEKGEVYINSKGGVELYKLDDFRSEGLELKFLFPEEIIYRQFNSQFVSSLSVLDVMMFNNVDSIRKMLGKYQLR